MLLSFIFSRRKCWGNTREIPVVVKALSPHPTHSSSSIADSNQAPALNIPHSGGNDLQTLAEVKICNFKFNDTAQ